MVPGALFGWTGEVQRESSYRVYPNVNVDYNTETLLLTSLVCLLSYLAAVFS